MTDFKASDRPVHALVAQADRQRRGRALGARLRQLAPIGAGLAAAVALVARLVGWVPWAGVGVLVGAAAALAAYALVSGRQRETTDAIASAVDADAGLAGELRSAHWFEAQAQRDAWAEFHLDHATHRASGVDWSTLYPRVSSARPWVATAVLSALAIALAVRAPGRVQAGPAVGVIDAAGISDGLSPEMRERLAALIAQLNQAVVDKDPTSKEMALADLKGLMEKMDPATQKKLAEMLEKQALSASAKKGETPAGDQRGDPLDKSAEGLPEDAKWALDNAAAKMAQSSEAQQPQGKPNAAQAGNKPGERGAGPGQAQQSTDGAPQSMTPLMRETAEQQNGKLMMGGGGPMGGDSKPGGGASDDASKGAAQALLVAQALKKELVEASADALGENVEKEDLRRKTEQGTSSLGFTRVAAPRVEPSRATAPPPVPDARRPLLFNYFIRRR
jgi:hypothetical protein